MSTQQKARLKWACRRGMLELDVILMPFFDACYDGLSNQELSVFSQLLQCDDPDLFSWFMGHQTCDHPMLKGMVEKIVSFNQSKLR